MSINLITVSALCFRVPCSSWTNLEDLQKWLTVREVQYQYHSVEAYKGAVYMGKWHLGRPHGVWVNVLLLLVWGTVAMHHWSLQLRIPMMYYVYVCTLLWPSLHELLLKWLLKDVMTTSTVALPWSPLINLILTAIQKYIHYSIN